MTGPDDKPTFPMPPPRTRNRGWIWYFIILGLLTITSLAILTRYNLSQQLKPEQLAEARRLWEKNGPADYDLECTQQGANPETRKVKVRDKKVISAIRNGQPLEPRLYRFSDMEALFGFVEDFLRLDAQPGKPKTYCTASFDSRDGHLTHYVRRVMGTSERVELIIQLSTPGS